MKLPVAPTWNAWRSAFNARKSRERVVMVMLATVVVLTIADRTALHPLQSRIRELEAQRDHGTVPLETRILPLKSLTEKTVRLRSELAQTEHSITDMRRDVVAPEQMRAMLQDLTARAPGVTLVYLRNLEPTPIMKNVAAADGAVPVWRHGLELTVQGSYADLVVYLTQLENLRRRVFWNRVDVDANAYPAVRLTIDLFTLSEDSAWLEL